MNLFTRAKRLDRDLFSNRCVAYDDLIVYHRLVRVSVVGRGGAGRLGGRLWRHRLWCRTCDSRSRRLEGGWRGFRQEVSGRRGGLLRLEAGVVGVVVTADVPIVGVLSDASIRVWQVVVQDVGRLVIGRTGLVGLEDAFGVLFGVAA